MDRDTTKSTLMENNDKTSEVNKKEIREAINAEIKDLGAYKKALKQCASNKLTHKRTNFFKRMFLKWNRKWKPVIIKKFKKLFKID